jgi:hypothetical protein
MELFEEALLPRTWHSQIRKSPNLNSTRLLAPGLSLFTLEGIVNETMDSVHSASAAVIS